MVSSHHANSLAFITHSDTHQHTPGCHHHITRHSQLPWLEVITFLTLITCLELTAFSSPHHHAAWHSSSRCLALSTPPGPHRHAAWHSSHKLCSLHTSLVRKSCIVCLSVKTLNLPSLPPLQGFLSIPPPGLSSLLPYVHYLTHSS